MLGEDHALLLVAQLREPAAAPERVPNGPLPERIEYRPPRALQQRFLEIRLVPDGVRAPEHREFRFLRQTGKSRSVEHRPRAIEEEAGILVHGEDADAARV